MAGQSPIFSKSYDFLLWLLNHTEKFPKSERFRLAKRLCDLCFDLHEHLIEATRSPEPALALREADLELEKLRFYIRLSHARKLTQTDQYEFAGRSLAEIGRLLGGWLKGLPGS